MDDTFKTLIDGLHKKYQDLISMSPVTIDTTPNNCPVGGVYLFSENGKPLYAGRTKRKIKTRLKGHVNTAKDCPFAWHLALECPGIMRTPYKKEGLATTCSLNLNLSRHMKKQKLGSGRWMFDLSARQTR